MKLQREEDRKLGPYDRRGKLDGGLQCTKQMGSERLDISRKRSKGRKNPNTTYRFEKLVYVCFSKNSGVRFRKPLRPAARVIR